MSFGHNKKPLEGQYLNIDELSIYIKRSKGAIRNLVLRRAIPFRKPAGRLLFLKSEIDLWIQRSPGKSLDEILEKNGLE
jgi:hypothetical protein